MAYTHRRAVNREDALDAVSETFAVLWRRLDDMPTGRSTVPWVYGIAKRVLSNQYRARDRRENLDHRLRNNTAIETDDETFDLVHQALAALRPKDREILTLATWDDLNNDEIAEVLDIPAANVAVRLHRARNRLARELGRLGMHGPGMHGPETNPEHMKSDGGDRTPNKVNGTHPEPGEVETL